MSNTRLTFKSIELTPDGILIREIAVIDAISGETLRASRLTEELTEFLRCVEIDIDVYFEIQTMREKNPAFVRLCDTFKLYS